MATCTTITASRGNRYAPQLPRKAPNETERLEHDISQDVDCAGAGITIAASVWRIDPADDDGALTLSQPLVTGLVTSTNYAGGTPGKAYLLHNDVDLSDGLQLTFSSQVVVAPTVVIAFGV